MNIAIPTNGIVVYPGHYQLGDAKIVLTEDLNNGVSPVGLNL
jgi:hypothetical protein